MRWLLRRWTWILEGPLYVGHLPSGSLNRCRLYVPARAVWGAITAEAARLHADGFPNYQEIGKELKTHARFSYLYPAENTDGEWAAWLPRYEEGRGLVWEHEAKDQDGTDDRDLRRRLLTTRPGTAIDPGSFTARDGSLRETECIAGRWRQRTKNRTKDDGDNRVAYVGYVFTTSQEAKRYVEAVELAFIGGDTRYGMGRMRRIGLEESETLFESRTTLDDAEPRVDTTRVLAHAAARTQLRGTRELLRGRSHGNELPEGKSEATWAPGSTVGETAEWTVTGSGGWRKMEE